MLALVEGFASTKVSKTVLPSTFFSLILLWEALNEVHVCFADRFFAGGLFGEEGC